MLPAAPDDATLTKTFQYAAEQFPWTQQYRDRSVTELEIRHAILNSLHAGDAAAASQMRCKFYFRDPRATFVHEPPGGAAAARSESPEALSKLHSLKSEIRGARLPCREYKNQTQFARASNLAFWFTC
jgi:hypothetical protein